METLIVTTKDKKELKFVADMLKKIHIKNRVLNEEEKEDNALGLMINEGIKTKEVSKKTILKELKR
ncbi:MAG: hypothetical protein JXB49_18755 [Bacteroidales bacterium]|nr:hypothetical protein [Bacteroidales bacterium]